MHPLEHTCLSMNSWRPLCRSKHEMSVGNRKFGSIVDMQQFMYICVCSMNDGLVKDIISLTELEYILGNKSFVMYPYKRI